MAVALSLLTSCGEQSKYEKAIADFVQTDKKGTWTDLQFKVIEMGDPTDITVKDSVALLTEKFDSEKSKRLATLNESIARHKVAMEKEHLNTMKKNLSEFDRQESGTCGFACENLGEIARCV